MRRLAWFVPLVVLLPGCGPGGGPSAQASPTPSATASAALPPSPTPSPALSPGPGPTPSPTAPPGPSPSAAPTAAGLPPGFAYSDFAGGSSGTSSSVVAVRVGAQAGFDRFVVQFSGGVPSYSVTRQPSARFTRSPRGDTVQLMGSAGVLVRLFPVANWTTYDGPTHFVPLNPYLREALLVENFEAVQQWGLGVSGPPALRVFVLGSPSRLVVDITTR